MNNSDYPQVGLVLPSATRHGLDSSLRLLRKAAFYNKTSSRVWKQVTTNNCIKTLNAGEEKAEVGSLKWFQQKLWKQ